MFGAERLFKPGLFIDDTVLGTVGITILKSRDAECAYTYATAAVLRGKDYVMRTVSTLCENCDDIYKNAKDLNERRYAADAEKAYQEAEALVEKYEAATEA